jgi:hypothetical protein
MTALSYLIHARCRGGWLIQAAFALIMHGDLGRVLKKGPVSQLQAGMEAFLCKAASAV